MRMHNSALEAYLRVDVGIIQRNTCRLLMPCSMAEHHFSYLRSHVSSCTMIANTLDIITTTALLAASTRPAAALRLHRHIHQILATSGCDVS
jgi:hypothetical protein